MTTLDRDDRRWQGFWGLALDVISKVINLPRTKMWLFPTPRPNELLCNCTRVIGADGLYERDFTKARSRGAARCANTRGSFVTIWRVASTVFVKDTGVQVGVR